MTVTIEKLLTTKDLSDMLGLPQYVIQRAINQNLFRCYEARQYRLVPETDTETLNMLKFAASLTKSHGISFNTAIEMLQSGVIPIETA